MMKLRGESLFFPTMGLWKISNENYIEHRGGGGATIFILKKKRKWKYGVGRSYNSCLLFHFDKMYVDTELDYET